MTAPAGQPWDNMSVGVVEPISTDGNLPPKKKGKRSPAPPASEPTDFGEHAEFGYLPIARLFESPRNPRKHYDPAKLAELTESVRQSGVLEALLVRPAPEGLYEIGAGHRRFRAAQAAGVLELPCRIREMDDAAFMELLTVSNLQRDDLHPLEEAAGYRTLMEGAGYDVARIAERVGRSAKYVYDRMKLLQLTKEAKKLFLDGAMTAGHAILLARLTPADQARAIESERSGNGRIGGLFVRDFGDDDLRLEEDDTQKPVSVREFDKWIADNVRFTLPAPDPMLFPETAATVQTATEQKEKVVAITHDYQVPPEAKGEGERTYGPMSWKRADGQDAHDPRTGRMAKSKTCDRSVTGVIVIGPGRGEAFKVCIDKKCAVHWPPAPEKKKAKGGKAESWEETNRRQTEAYRKQAEAEKALAVRWGKAQSAILEALVAKIKTAPTGANGPLAGVIMHAVSRQGVVKGQPAIPRGSTAADLVRHVAFLLLADVVLSSWRGPREFPKMAKALGVDVAKILDQVAPEPKADTEPKPAPKKPAKPKAKKNGARK